MGHSFVSLRVPLESGSVGDGWLSHLLQYPICCKTPLFPQRDRGQDSVPVLLGNVTVISPTSCDDFREPQFPSPC